MAENLHSPTTERGLSAVRFTGKDTRQRPLASGWVTLLNPTGVGPAGEDCGTADPDDPTNTFIIYTWTPCLQNSWQQPTGTLELFAFRKHYDGSLEFKGHLDSSGGAVSATIAFTLPGIAGGEPDYTLPNDQYFHTTITPDNGTTFSLALCFIDSTTGDVTITWPAT